MGTTTGVIASQMPALTGDVTSAAGAVATTVGKINGTSLAGLTTGLLKNTTSTGVPSIAVAGTDYSLLTVQTGTLSSGADTKTVPAGCHPWVQDTASVPSGPMSVTVSGTTATIHGTGSDTYTLVNAGSQ